MANGMIPPAATNEFEAYQDYSQHQPNSLYENRGSPQPNNDQANQILQALSSGELLSTLDIAHAIGCKAIREVNPIVYTMHRKKLLERSNETPPMWRLSPAGLDHIRKNPSAEMPSGRPPPNPQELFQKNSWRAGNNSQPFIINAYSVGSQGTGNNQTAVPSSYCNWAVPCGFQKCSWGNNEQ